MLDLIHQLISSSAQRAPDALALSYQGRRITYLSLSEQVNQIAVAYLEMGIKRNDRVAIYLEKRPEAVIAMFAASAAGAVFVPINPILKPDQLAFILNDCNVRILITSADRLRSLHKILPKCTELTCILVLDSNDKIQTESALALIPWERAGKMTSDIAPHRCIDADMAAILYTSGSTGKPKGVVLSHRNILAGAASVAQYLNNHSEDRILALLPFSFDYGFSQLTTAFSVGASVVLMNYLLPQDVIRVLVEEKITGLAAVPPLWSQLIQINWPRASALNALRYITNSGGAMPRTSLAALRKIFPDVDIYLMYGLTEAFRSSYLPPSEVETRPDSIGKAIPGAELIVVNKAGQICAPNEAGELVHRGALVALGYWNDAEKTAERFRPAPGKLLGLTLPEIAVWSGDNVRMDHDGYLYFIGRDDDMIKVSGYRVSPLEVEEVVDRFDHITEQVAVGVPHPLTGQAIVLVVKQNQEGLLDATKIRKQCQVELPTYLVPAYVEIMSESLPRNANGKIDRKLLQSRFMDFFKVDANAL